MSQLPRVDESEFLSHDAFAGRMVSRFLELQITARALGVTKLIEAPVLTGQYYLDRQDEAVLKSKLVDTSKDMWYVFMSKSQQALDGYNHETETTLKQVSDTLYDFIGLALCRDLNLQPPVFTETPAT